MTDLKIEKIKAEHFVIDMNFNDCKLPLNELADKLISKITNKDIADRYTQKIKDEIVKINHEILKYIRLNCFHCADLNSTLIELKIDYNNYKHDNVYISDNNFIYSDTVKYGLLHNSILSYRENNNDDILLTYIPEANIHVLNMVFYDDLSSIMWIGNQVLDMSDISTEQDVK